MMHPDQPDEIKRLQAVILEKAKAASHLIKHSEDELNKVGVVVRIEFGNEESGPFFFENKRFRLLGGIAVLASPIEVQIKIYRYLCGRDLAVMTMAYLSSLLRY